MELMEAIRDRRSVRAYRRKAVPESKIETLVAALRRAPSSGNYQRRRFLFVRERSLRVRLARAALNQTFVAEAPLVVVACADLRIERDYGDLGRDLLCLLDVAASVQNLLLAAHAEGLGACWVGGLEEDEVRDLLDLPAYLRPISMVSVGYPAEAPPPPPLLRRSTAIKFVK